MSFTCKFHKKKGFHSCPRQLHVCSLSTSKKIQVFTNDEEHEHVEDLDHITSTNYHLTSPQIQVITNYIKFGGENNNKIILKQLVDSCLFNGSGKFPTAAQVGTKKRYLKKLQKKYEPVVTTADLIKFCEENSEVPDDEHKTYIPYYYPTSVDEEQVDEYRRPIGIHSSVGNFQYSK